MNVEIIEGYNKTDKRSFPAKDGKEARDVFTQKGYLHKGGAFPVEFNIPLESLAQAYSVGHYVIDPQCLEVDKYGKLTLNPYSIVLVPAKKAA